MQVFYQDYKIGKYKSIYLQSKKNGCVAQLNRAFDYESKGFRFES